MIIYIIRNEALCKKKLMNKMKYYKNWLYFCSFELCN